MTWRKHKNLLAGMNNVIELIQEFQTKESIKSRMMKITGLVTIDDETGVIVFVPIKC